MKNIIFLFVLFFSSDCYADQFTGILEGLRQDSTGLYVTYDSVNYHVIDSTMQPFVIDVYNAGLTVTVDYNLSNEINFLFTSSASGYPIDDFSKIFSFVLGGIACACFIQGIRIKYTG